MSYYELWNVLSLWKDEFTTREFASTFASPDPNKVLHDMSRKGLLAKTGRGRYRAIPQWEYVKTRMDISAAYEMVKAAGLPYAFSGVDAVFFWTRGGYNVDRFFGFYPIHLKVRREDLSKWQRFLRSSSKKFTVEGRPVVETLFGVFYFLQPVGRLRTEEVEGYSVEPLNDVVRFCTANVYAYEPALEMLNDMYGLHLSVRYRELGMPK